MGGRFVREWMRLGGVEHSWLAVSVGRCGYMGGGSRRVDR